MGFELTEDSSRCVVTGETGLTHTRTISQFISFMFLTGFGALSGRCGWWLGAIGVESHCRRGRLGGKGGNDRDRGQIDAQTPTPARSSGRKGSHIPIVNDESSNFLCNERDRLAFAIQDAELGFRGGGSSVELK